MRAWYKILADDVVILLLLLIFFQENRFLHVMKIVSKGNNLHKAPKLLSRVKPSNKSAFKLYFNGLLLYIQHKYVELSVLNISYLYQEEMISRKHAYVVLTPLNSIFTYFMLDFYDHVFAFYLMPSSTTLYIMSSPKLRVPLYKPFNSKKYILYAYI